MHALVAPLAEAVTASPNGWYGRFLSRVRWDRFALDVLQRRPAATSWLQAQQLLAAQLADLPRLYRHSRMEMVTTLVVGTVGSWEWRRDRGEPHLSPADLVAELVTSSVGVLRADALARP